MSTEIRRLLDEFIAYYSRGGGCSNCGGLPHSTTCFVGRFQSALLAAAPPPTEARKLCEECGGNGVIKIFSGTAQIGTSVCPACHGDGWATRPAAPPPVDPQVECPVCGEIVKQVSSCTLNIALWQHWNWAHRASPASSAPAGQEELLSLVEDFAGWWHLNREGSVNRTYAHIDAFVKALDGLFKNNEQADLLNAAGHPPTEAQKDEP